MALDGRKVNLFIVGAAKCGTTSLHYYLSQHPDIFMCPVKETHHFADEIIKGNSEVNLKHIKKDRTYHTYHIEDRREYDFLFSDIKNETIIGESSPTYLWSEGAALKIFSYNPNAKIIVILRNPIERAYSHYISDFSFGLNKCKTFDESVKEGVNAIGDKSNRNFLYLDFGFYYKQISRYRTLFSDEQILIIPFDELKANPLNVMSKAFTFLKVKNISKSLSLKVHNPTVVPINGLIKKVVIIYQKFPNFNRFIYNTFSNKVINAIKQRIYKPAKSSIENISKETKNTLKKIYADDIEFLKKISNNHFHL